MIIATRSSSPFLRLLTLSLAALLLFGAASALVSCSSEKDDAAELTPDQIQGNLIRQLIMMAEQKERSRDLFDSLVTEKGWKSPEVEEATRREAESDSVNMARLEEIIAKHGWPGQSLVGNRAAVAAFLILQHGSLQQQEKYLPIVKAASDKGDVEPAHLAMLQDRVLMRQGKPQIYGTQLWNDPSSGELGLYPIEDSANVNSRRAEIGLAPVNEYLRSIGINPDSLGKKDRLEVIIK